MATPDEIQQAYQLLSELTLSGNYKPLARVGKATQEALHISKDDPGKLAIELHWESKYFSARLDVAGGEQLHILEDLQRQGAIEIKPSGEQSRTEPFTYVISLRDMDALRQAIPVAVEAADARAAERNEQARQRDAQQRSVRHTRMIRRPKSEEKERF